MTTAARSGVQLNTIATTAARLAVSRATIRRAIALGWLRATRPSPRTLRVSDAEISAFIARRTGSRESTARPAAAAKEA
jgi:excisionase family DNA binding protein